MYLKFHSSSISAVYQFSPRFKSASIESIGDSSAKMSQSKYANRGLPVAIEKLYLDASTADMHFVFESDDGQSERIPAHKLLLSAYSEVFKEMFSVSLKEQPDVKIVDASPAAFKQFLQFFYCDEIEMTTENVDEVMRLGQQYLVAECSNVCAQFLADNLTNENVCAAYGVSLSIDHEELKKLCEVSIGINVEDVFETKGFLECDRQVLSHILKLDSLSCSEIDVFIATMDWVKAISKQKTLNKETVMTHLGDVFYEIRFGAMNTDELNGIFSSYANLFTAELRSEIAKMIQSTDTNVEKRPRECAWNKTAVIECERDTEMTDEDDHEPYHIKANETTTFTTNKPLLLRAIVCGGVYEFRKYKYMESLEEPLDGELSIFEYRGAFNDDEKSYRVVYNKEVSVGGVIRLTKPVIIKPGMNYKILLESEESDYYPFCTDFRFEDSEVKIEGKGIIVKFINDAVHKGSKRGLIYGLHFNEI